MDESLRPSFGLDVAYASGREGFYERGSLLYVRFDQKTLELVVTRSRRPVTCVGTLDGSPLGPAECEDVPGPSPVPASPFPQLHQEFLEVPLVVVATASLEVPPASTTGGRV